MKAPAGFKFMTYRFVVNVLTNCATLLGNNIVREKIYKITIWIGLMPSKLTF